MRYIMHADFDAFYASVEQRDDPELRGKPVVVGGSPSVRGVVASASYEARKYGIRSAMPMRTALQRCSWAARVRPRFDRYREVSRQVMAIFREVTPLVEPLSMDEAYLDVSESVTSERPANLIARELKERVKSELALTISVGVATSKSVAKIASDIQKPDGLTIVAPGSEREFLAPLEARRLWGVGPKTAERLSAEGIGTIGDLAGRPEEWFQARFGRLGPRLRRLALGQDEQPVVVYREAKSVSAESTMAQDTDDPDTLHGLIAQLSERVADHLRCRDLSGRTVKVKMRLADFTTFTRQRTLQSPARSTDELARVAGELLDRELERGRLFRLLGVGVSGFESSAGDEPLQAKLAGFE